MNILIPHQWLLEQLETSATPEKIQTDVSLCGPSIERIYDREGDSVYDIEVTTNRVDSMSVRGIAREAAVILTQFGIQAELKPLKLHQPKSPTKADQLSLPKITNNPKYCQRVMCVVLSNVERTATPEWMAKRLRQIEISVHDSVIDITNYITHELGHPCHAFDYDRIMALGGEIIVTEAKPGEKFTTLDGISYETVGGEIVFKNPAGEIIDLPAIKGTANSSINDQTKNVLLWVESLDAKKVRFASMTHAIRTVAAQLNEKKVDPNLAESVLLRGIELYQQLCDATVASPIYDDFPDKKQAKPVTIALDTIHQYLGLTLKTSQIISILNDLGCEVTQEKDRLVVTPPSFRPDITIPADVVEEIARIYGYHNLPSTLMDTPIPTIKPTDTDYVIEGRIKRFLAAIGWQEVYTYSMVSETIALESGYALSDHLKLQNPLTDDRVYLRRSLLPSLREIITTNNQKKDLAVFELAMTYLPQANDLPEQKLHLSLVAAPGENAFGMVKGVVESLLQQFFVTATFPRVEKMQSHHAHQFANLALIMIGDEEIGEIGQLQSGHIATTIVMPNLLKIAKKYPIYQPIPKTGSIGEDLTFTLPTETPVGEVMASIQQVNGLITHVAFIGEYQQNNTFRITYHHPEYNITGEEVTPIRSAIITQVQKEYGATLVGALE